MTNELVALLAGFTLHPIDYMLSEEVDRYSGIRAVPIAVVFGFMEFNLQGICFL